jgi:hypothetical protein
MFCSRDISVRCNVFCVKCIETHSRISERCRNQRGYLVECKLGAEAETPWCAPFEKSQSRRRRNFFCGSARDARAAGLLLSRQSDPGLVSGAAVQAAVERRRLSLSFEGDLERKKPTPYKGAGHRLSSSTNDASKAPKRVLNEGSPGVLCGSGAGTLRIFLPWV